MSDVTLPSAHAALVGPGGVSQTYFYRWLQATDNRIKGSVSTGVDNQAAIAEIAIKLGSPDGSVAGIPAQGNAATINGSGSILVDGTLSNGVVNLSLMADTLYPGATTYYGSGPNGARGWFPVSDALEDSVSIAVSTDPSTGVSAFDLKPTGVEAGTFGAGVKLLVVTVGADGRLSGISEKELIAGNGISFDIDPDTGAVTISVNSFVATNRITRAGDTRVTRSGDIRITR